MEAQDKLHLCTGGGLVATGGYAPKGGTGNVEQAKLALASGADPGLNNPARFGGATPFHWACYMGHEELVLYLASRSDAERYTSRTDTVYGETPFWSCCQNGRTHLAKVLLKGIPTSDLTKPRFKHQGGETPLLIAQNNGHVETAAWLQQVLLNDK